MLCLHGIQHEAFLRIGLRADVRPQERVLALVMLMQGDGQELASPDQTLRGLGVAEVCLAQAISQTQDLALERAVHVGVHAGVYHCGHDRLPIGT